jgi:hypothetical protein
VGRGCPAVCPSRFLNRGPGLSLSTRRVSRRRQQVSIHGVSAATSLTRRRGGGACSFSAG